MAVYDYQCQNEECKHEIELEHSIKQDPIKICPKCGQETFKRLISLQSKGVVLLEGKELEAHIKADAKRIEREASQNEYKYASLLGESKYENIQRQMDKRRK